MSRRRLTAKEKAEKKRRKKEFMTIFVNGKQKRVRRPPTIDGIDAEEFILRNADPLWLHQNGLWEYMDETGTGEEITEVMKQVIDQVGVSTDAFVAAAARKSLERTEW